MERGVLRVECIWLGWFEWNTGNFQAQYSENDKKFGSSLSEKAGCHSSCTRQNVKGTMQYWCTLAGQWYHQKDVNGCAGGSIKTCRQDETPYSPAILMHANTAFNPWNASVSRSAWWHKSRRKGKEHAMIMQKFKIWKHSHGSLLTVFLHVHILLHWPTSALGRWQRSL